MVAHCESSLPKGAIVRISAFPKTLESHLGVSPGLDPALISFLVHAVVVVAVVAELRCSSLLPWPGLEPAQSSFVVGASHVVGVV